MTFYLPRSDKDYFNWIANHATGFVLNTYEPPDDYLKLHRPSKCWHVTKLRVPGAYTERDERKVCAESFEEIVAWVTSQGLNPRRIGRGCSCNFGIP
jgi:hypothetical protein